MARFDWRNPSRGLAITVIAVAAICLGFLADLIITCFEKNAYPQDYAEYVTVYAERYGVPEELKRECEKRLTPELLGVLERFWNTIEGR